MGFLHYKSFRINFFLFIRNYEILQENCGIFLPVSSNLYKLHSDK